MTKKVALVGTAGSAVNAPFDDDDWEIWGVGNRASYVKRATRWFELHRLDGEDKEWANEWRKLIRTWSNECEIWMFYPEEDLGPNIVPFNPKPLLEKYSSFFMTSSFSWMMAQAIEEGAEEIGLWGVDMEYGTEYKQQRTGLRHFIEIAKMKGIMIRRVASSGIAYDPIPYPFWQDDPMLSKISLRQNIVMENIEALTGSKKIMESMTEGYRAAIKEIEMMSGEDYDPQKRLKDIEKELGLSLLSSAKINGDLARSMGAEDEINWTLDFLQS